MAISIFVAGDVVPMGPTIELFKQKQKKYQNGITAV